MSKEDYYYRNEMNNNALGSRISMVDPTGKVGTIPRNNLSRALDSGFKLHNVGERVKVVDPTGKEGSIPTNNLSKALQNGFILPEAGWGDVAQGFVKGAATGLGKVADTGIAAVSKMASYLDPTPMAAQGLVSPEEQQQYKQATSDVASDFWQNDKIAKVASDTLDTGVGYDPSVQVSEVAGEAGSQLLPFSAAAKGVQLATKVGGVAKLPWIQKLNAFLETPLTARNATAFAGMGAGSELAKSNEASDTENIIREVIGGIVGGITAPAAAGKAVQGLYKLTTEPLKTTKAIITSPYNAAKEAGSSLLAATTGGKLNKEALASAQRIGLQLPPGLATDSTLAKAIQNTALKSWFSSKAYNEVMQNIPKKLIEELESNLDQIAPKLIDIESSKTAGEVASGQFKEALSNRSVAWKEESNKLFDNAIKSLKDTDVIEPKETLAAIKQMKSDLDIGLRDPQGAKASVLNALTELEQKIALRGGKAKIKDLVGEQQDLMKLGKYGDVTGYENYFNGLANVITEEVSKYKGNKIFSDNYLPARNFYKENIVDRLRSDIARSVLSGENSKLAISYMKTPQQIRELSNVLGNHPNAKEIMQTLKRAKISEILESKGVINSTGEFNSNRFLSLFSKDSNNELLRELMGPNLKRVQQNITPIAKVIESSKKVLGNPSETANVMKDFGIAANIATGLATAATTGSVPVGVGVAAGGAGLINIVSRAFASPKYLQKLINRANRLENAIPLKDKIKSSASKVANTAAAKYQAVNFGVNAAMPAAAGFGSDMLFGKEFTEKVKNKYNEKKNDKSRKD